MSERFTDRARMVISNAQAEARQLGHHYIGTEHLLLGLLAEGDGIAGKALTGLGLTLEAAREAVERVVGLGGSVPTGHHVPFTMHGKDVLERGFRQALLLGHSYIGTEHLLLGLLDIKESTKAEKVLAQLDLDVGDVRQQVLVRLSLTDLALNVRYPSIPQLKLQLELARAQVTALEQKLSEAEARELLQST